MPAERSHQGPSPPLVPAQQGSISDLSLLSSFQRPTAKELLKHRFIKTAKKASFLTEVIERHQVWRAKGGAKAEEAEIAAYDA